jgi:hypothetical protein
MMWLFIRTEKKVLPIVKVAHPEKIKTEYNDRPQPLLTSNNIAIVPAKPNLSKAEPGPVPASSIETIDEVVKVEPQSEQHADKTPVADLPKTDIKNIPASSVSVTPTQVTKTIAEPKNLI